MPKADLAQIAIAQTGTWCYVWGGNGEDMTAMGADAREEWICKRESDEDNRARVRKLYSTLVESGVETIRGGDCSGFVYWCMSQLGIWKTDRNANAMYTNSTRTDVPEAGDLAFRLGDDGKATHVGIYVGDGNFVHSKGRDVGVVNEQSKDGYWHAYGIIKEFQPEPEPPEPGTKYVRFLGSVSLRTEPKKDSKRVKIAHKGDKLPLLSRDHWDDRTPPCEWYEVDFKGRSLYCSAYTWQSKAYTEVVE